MPTSYPFRNYDSIDWAKFSVPVFTSTAAWVLCLSFLSDCKLSIHVEEQWIGLFSYAGDGDHCRGYATSALPLVDDPQLRTAQIGGLLAIFLGFPLWLSLVASPFWNAPNGVWPKLISIAVALVIGNLQLLVIVKFIRAVMAAYPDEKVFFEYQGVVVSSIIFWLLTAVAIAICAPKTKPPNQPIHQLSSARLKKSRSNRDQVILKSASDDTKETLAHGKDVEDGMVEIYNSASEESKGVHDEIELCLSASADCTLGSI